MSLDASYFLESPLSSAPTSAPSMEYKDEHSANIWLLVMPRITACISLLGIACVSLEAWKDLQADKRRSVVRSSRIRSSTTTRQNVSIISRIQLFYQIPLFSYTLALAFGTQLVPQGQAWGAIGSVGSCSLQGFMLQFGLHGVYAWDSVLSTTYLMMVRYKVANLRLRSFEKYYHVVAWSFATIVSIVPLSQEMYNFNNTICWLESYPDNCEGDECLRGAGAAVWQNVASLIAIIHLIYSVSVMTSIYCSIRGMEDTKERYAARHAGSSIASNTLAGSRSVQTSNSVAASIATARRKNSRAVGIQGMLYASGMIITLFPTALSILLWNAFGLWLSDGYAVFSTSVVPLIGYANFCIFMRGRTVESCHTAYAKALRRAHSWMFDYELQCECLPRHRRRSAEPTGEPANHSEQNQSHPYLCTVSGQLPVVDEDHDPEMAKQDAGETAAPPASTKTSPISGFTVKVKSKGNRFGQWVSELGASIFSGDEDSSSEFEDDVIPSKEAVVDKKPPSKPMRMLSELLGDSSGNNQHQNGKTPPVRPERQASCVFDHSFDNSATRKPPSKPERLETEVETSDHQGSQSFERRVPPLGAQPQKRKIASPTEAADNLPPVKKGLFSGFTIRVKHKGNKANQPVSELGASEIFEDEDCSTETYDNNIPSPCDVAAGDLTATRPMRALCEVPCDANKSHHDRAAPVRPERQESYPRDCSCNPDQKQKLATIPIKPERLESIVLDDSNGNSATRRPPSKPDRYETEVEPSDHQDSFAGEAPSAIPHRHESNVAQRAETADSLSPRKKSLFSGFVIKIKRKSRGRKSHQQVSELGASGASEEEESCSETDKHFTAVVTKGDNNIQNQASSCQSQLARPEKPGKNTLDNSHYNSSAKRPPIKPERYESEIETSNHQGSFTSGSSIQGSFSSRGSPASPQSHGREVNMASRHAPPHQPQRLSIETGIAAELETSFSFHEHSFHGAPPTIPEGAAEGQAPPLLPRRLSSETGIAAELETSFSFHEHSFHGAPPTIPEGAAQGQAPPLLPRRLSSETVLDAELATSFAFLEHSFHGAPPTIPEGTANLPIAARALPPLEMTQRHDSSEVEHSEKDDSSLQVDALPIAAKALAPLKMPQRHLSNEVEHSEKDDSSLQLHALPITARALKPLKMPQRHVSNEVEHSETDDSSRQHDSSFTGTP